MYPRGGVCTVSVAYPTYGFAAGKDIPKVVSDGKINPMHFLYIFSKCPYTLSKRPPGRTEKNVRNAVSDDKKAIRMCFLLTFVVFCIVDAQHLSTARQRKIQPFYFVNSIAASAKRLPRVSILR